MMSLEKKNLRKKVSKIIAEIAPDKLEQQNAKIICNLDNLLKSENFYPSSLGIFYPIPGEVNCLNLKHKGNIAFPFFGEDSNEMEFKLSSLNELEIIHAFGQEFRMPSKSSLTVDPEVLIVPGIAFDKNGHRLGRGKGYYDRYLMSREVKKKEPIKIGICFNQQFQQSVPCDEHDQVMDFIVTDKNVIKVK